MPKGPRPFVKGKPKTGGRKKGTPNKVTHVMRELVTQAAAEVGDPKGGDKGVLAYLKYLAIEEPKVFGGILGKTVERQVQVDVRERVIVRNYTGVARIGLGVLRKLKEQKE